MRADVELLSMRNGSQTEPATDDLGGVAEVAEALFITKSALADRRHRPDFPETLAELTCGPVWGMDEIDPYDLERDQAVRARRVRLGRR